ncbi:MAG: prepilin peptidase [Kiritimatiellae bacterium]|nr:prepilin peptidase [Kiritimatiellia bacterium]
MNADAIGSLFLSVRGAAVPGGATLALAASAWLPSAVFAVLVGACVGSFLNVCIYRIPLDQSVVRPGSHCMTCGKPIRWYHNIPVLSYFMLRGKCASCGAPFSFRYAAVELLVALLFLLAFCLFPPAGALPPLGMRWLAVPVADDGTAALRALWQVPVWWLFVSGLVVATFVDLDHLIIPDSVTVGGAAAGLLLSALVPEIQARTVLAPDASGALLPVLVQAHSWREGLLQSAVGAAAGSVPLYLVRAAGTWWFRRRGRIGKDDYAMGLGDIKFVAALGAFLGWQGAAFCIGGGAFLGVLVAVPLMALGKRSLLDRIPFGPYLAGAGLLWLLWGPFFAAFYAAAFA